MHLEFDILRVSLTCVEELIIWDGRTLIIPF